MVREEGIPLLEIVKNAPKSGEVYIGGVDIAVSPVMPKSKDNEVTEIPPMFVHRILFNPVDSEIYSFALPFDGNDFFVVFTTGDERKSIRISVDKAK